MAVGIVIGVAFGKIVSSLVGDIIMPPIGKVMGGMDFSNLFVVLGGRDFATLAAAQQAGAATINYGVFINVVLEFIIVAFALFLIVKMMNKIKREQPAAPPTTHACPECLSDIPIGAKRCKYCTAPLAR